MKKEECPCLRVKRNLEDPKNSRVLLGCSLGFCGMFGLTGLIFYYQNGKPLQVLYMALFFCLIPVFVLLKNIFIELWKKASS
ncbi:MAG: hypothetical protein ABIA37_03070 [Candidatus Woesearchaeota archaeon]